MIATTFAALIFLTMHVLALSSSRVGGGAYLEKAAPLIETFLGKRAQKLAFVPFAAADKDDEGYASKVRQGLSSAPYEIEVVTPETGKEVLSACDAILIGGGNTFKLLHDLYCHDLFSLIRQRVRSGTPYIGWSAGANLAGPTLCTTNDMPIIQPQSFTAFGFLPFQLNPHYYNLVVEGFHGETRDQRLAEFLLLNPAAKVMGLPEGTALQRQHNSLQLLGESEAMLFTYKGGLQTKRLSPGSDLSALLEN